MAKLAGAGGFYTGEMVALFFARCHAHARMGPLFRCADPAAACSQPALDHHTPALEFVPHRAAGAQTCRCPARSKWHFYLLCSPPRVTYYEPAQFKKPPVQPGLLLQRPVC